MGWGREGMGSGMGAGNRVGWVGGRWWDGGQGQVG